MLGIFKGKNKEKANNCVITNDKNERKQNKKNEVQEKGKEEKFSRFSFKRRRSSEKKKKNKAENADLSSSSSTSSIVSWPSSTSGGNEKASPAGVKPDEIDLGDPISEASSACADHLGNPERGMIEGACDSLSSSSNRTKSSMYCSEDESLSSNSELNTSSSLRSEKYLQNSKPLSGNVFVIEPSTSTKIEVPNTSNTFNKSIHPSFLTTRSRCSIAGSNESIKTLTRSTSNDGTLSMISTPSSSTSSLSSISNRPISPSGRGTPAGPKLGIALRIPSSPTPIRKTSRTHIKTNPSISSTSRRAGATTPSSNLPVKFPSMEKVTDSPTTPEISNCQSSCFLSKSPIISRSSDSKTIFTYQDNNTLSPPQSPSANSARLRLSVSSMQSLESIPEIDSDVYGDAKDTLRRNKLNSKLVNIPLGISSGPNCTSKDELHLKVSECVRLQNGSNHSIRVTKTNQEIQGRKTQPVKQMESKESNCYSNTNKFFTKPPSISKRSRDLDIPNLNNSSIESKRPLTMSHSSSPLPKDNPKEIMPTDFGVVNKIAKNNNAFASEKSVNGDITIEKHTNGEATHVVFKIAINNSKNRTSSLEDLPNNKLLFKDDVFPMAGCPRCPLIKVRRSKSLTRVDAIENGTYVKFTIPITKDELKRQAAKFVNNFEEKKDDINKINRVVNTNMKNSTINRQECTKSNKPTNSKQCCPIKPTQSPKSTRLNETHSHLIQNTKSPKKTKLPQNTSPQFAKLSTREDKNLPRTQNNNTQEEIHKKELNLAKLKTPGILADSLTGTRTEPLPEIATKMSPRTFQESPPDTPSLTLNSNEISETDSVTQDTSNSQNIVQEVITIQIEDSPNFISRKIDLDSSFEELQKSLQDKLIQTEENNDDEKISKKEFVAQEERYQKQVDDLSMKLAEKQQEAKDLAVELKEAKNATLKKESSEQQRYEIQIDQLKTRIREEETRTESVRVELQYARNEVEFSQAKMRRLEEDLTKANELSDSLREQNANRSQDSARLKELEEQVKSLEDKLRKSECTRKDLETSLAEIETERDEEMKIVQDALDEAAEERQELITSFKKELELLNTTNTAREQQMLDDFEWKLHEMEKDYKNKLEDNSRQAEERLRTLRFLVESELSETLTSVTEERKLADEKLMEVGHLKSYEAEVIQLRGVTHEFQKALRASAREMENMKLRERLLNDEIRGFKIGAQSRQNTLQRAKRHNDEGEIRDKLEKQRNEINAEWEDKLRKECSRLKAELDDLHSEEKHLAVESMKVQKEQEIQRLRKSWELRQDEMATQVSSLKDSLADKDAYYHRELDNQRTMTDRDLWDLRMKLQKLTESSYDQKQQLEEKYREDMERLRVDYDERTRELESRLAICDAEKGVDLISQMEKEHKKQMQYVGEQHQLSMERLREELEAEKFQAVEDTRVIITKLHVETEANLKEQLSQMKTNESQIRDELEAFRSSLQRREETLKNVEEELERYKDLKGDSSYSSTNSSYPPATSTTSSGFNSSQFSLASNDSQGSRNSQDRYSYHDSVSLAEGQDDSQRNSGLLGKVFGGGWFTPSKSYSRRCSTPLSNKKPYT